ncbi:MAG TPA: UDP-N-acetylmuramoylalanyl-D-glutamyl-2, 6-diaminopimelate--D-alanyl-D-alanine ligase, partial [Xanthobacteraceae bacterium]|nr:UDP-N-acetylmuramoylalanyl-D-glutamyl-2, 6-diaminopimelate--D-alanyl-D-alanine ligase [Xanthobacteraceae bacterium]
MSVQPLWTVEAMAAAMGAKTQGVLLPFISGISIDSRTIGPGEAFFAIQGD